MKRLTETWCHLLTSLPGRCILRMLQPYSIRYSVDSTRNEFVVRKTPVHPYSECLYFGEVEHFTVAIHMYKLYEEISNILNTSNHIDIINIEQNDSLEYKGNFSNSSIVDHVYHVSIDPNLPQRGMVTSTQRKSVLKISSWKILASAASSLFQTLCQVKETTRATCADQFRCLSSKVCIPIDQICDGIPQCPFDDDEVMCDFHCLAKCSCRLYILNCKATNFTQKDFVDLATNVRNVDIGENNPFEKGIFYIPKKFPYLITLLAKNCGITSVEGNTFQNATNIRHLDLSFNRIKIITNTTFEGLQRLEFLNLKGNYYISSIHSKAFNMLTSLSTLAITNTRLQEIQADTFSGLKVTLLNVSHNQISKIENRAFNKLSAMIHLDLSFNRVKVITNTTFEGLQRLEFLNLKRNYIESIQPKAFKMLKSISSLTITNTRLQEIQTNTFWGLNIKLLNISHNQIRKIESRAFNKLSASEIEFYGNEIDTFDDDIFTGVDTVQLKTIRSPAYKFCCVKPHSVSDDNCWPHQDEFSSCEDLMRNPILQTLIWNIGVIAVVANGCTILYRLVYDRKSLKKGFGVFVTNLAASDFLMGVYMIIIAMADITFRKRYMIMDDYWRNSAWCGFAGVLATVSSEASVLFMFLITVDRILVIKYPFGRWKFSQKNSKVALVVSWTIALTIALIPILVPDYFEGKFYSTSGVCLALPLTHRRPPGWLYSFLVYVALNFVAFTLIAFGQLVIYLEIKASSKRMKKVRSQRLNDVRIAKNLLLVLFTDFLCWFPVGVMAIMAATGYIIPGEIYAWTAVLIVPVNAALNPFLYTLSAVIRKKASSKASNQALRQVPEQNINKKIIVSKDFNIQCNIDVETNKDIPGTQKVLVYTPLDDVQTEKITLGPREVLSTYIATARSMKALHADNLVYGGFQTGDVLFSSEGKKIRMCYPHPLRSTSKYDQIKDVYEFGSVLEHLLQFTNSSN